MNQLEKMRSPEPSPARSGVFGFRGRPDSPRSLIAVGNVISWVPPGDLRGVKKFRIYLDNEANLVHECEMSKAPANLTSSGVLNSFGVTLNDNNWHAAFVSSVSELGRESPKIPIMVKK